jgi:hypothetical protein
LCQEKSGNPELQPASFLNIKNCHEQEVGRFSLILICPFFLKNGKQQKTEFV